MIRALHSLLAMLLVLAAGASSAGGVRAAECMSGDARSCAEWKVYADPSAPSYSSKDMLSWSAEQWSNALESCRRADQVEQIHRDPGPLGIRALVGRSNSFYVSSGLCGQIFAVSELCKSPSASLSMVEQCYDWGLLDLPVYEIPDFVQLVVDNWSGLKTCGFIYKGISSSLGPRAIPGLKPVSIQSVRADAPAIGRAYDEIRDIYETIKSSPEGRAAQEAYQTYRANTAPYAALKKVKDTVEKLYAAYEFVSEANAIGPERFVMMAAIGSPQTAHGACMRQHQAGSPSWMKCIEDAGSDTAAAVKAAQMFSEYMSQVDVVQCFQAAGNVANFFRK